MVPWVTFQNSTSSVQFKFGPPAKLATPYEFFIRVTIADMNEEQPEKVEQVFSVIVLEPK